MKIILIGNYPPDKQESMQRFALLLKKSYNSKFNSVTIWKPKNIVGKIIKSNKWIGYIDKWILFPLIILFRRLVLCVNTSNCYYHICDHSNAPYLDYLPRKRTLITCHDVLAIRGAMGYEDAYCDASKMGIFLQKWILDSLSKAKKIACVSRFSLNQLKDLCPDNNNSENWKVIYNSFNASFKALDLKYAKSILHQNNIRSDVPYIFHIGSSLPRKNRILCIKMLEYLPNWNGQVVFAGQKIDTELHDQITKRGFSDRVISVEKPNHLLLNALYTCSEALIFPSLSEGFGWPIIEAQKSGTPVITSITQPMPEVGGEGALYANPRNPEEFANKFKMLQNHKIRNEYIRKGLANTIRFSSTEFTKNYINLLTKDVK